jgi:uncharacterized SAM-binding protein YcdF (DUF218 family)
LFSATLIVLFGFTSFGSMIMAPLEDRFQRPAEMPAKVDTIIVLGGGFDGKISAARRNEELTAAGDRFVEALRLARIYPEAKIVVSGGFGSLVQSGETDAEIAKRFYEGMGIAPERLIFEGRSRNTEENAQMTRALVDPKPGETVLLVTSAFHMPRSMGLFRAAGFDVIAWPTDYRTPGAESFGVDASDPVENLRVGSTAVREWIGLLTYKLTGKIADWFPAP